MPPVDTFAGAFGNIAWFVGDVAFTWVPATVGTVTGTAPGSSPPISLISQPVTLTDAAAFLQGASQSEFDALYRSWAELVAISIVLSLLFGALVIYCAVRIMEVRRHERMRFEAAVHPVAAHDIPRTQLRWNGILEEANSDDERKWRLAILEADIMLNELLDVQGYRGETMADKMKQAERSTFRSIDAAWEAHRTRNQIAHEGSAHLLSAREVRRVMAMYEEVFREFKFIE
ncbi:MAG: hypothetical protein P4L81_02305 [Candidatus Pacebacteria bacterium]|nr:hypothetical protein [Candidatus Paceibacterota bacterium]